MGGRDKVAQLDIFQIHRTSERRRNPKTVNLSFARSKASALSFAGQPDHEVSGAFTTPGPRIPVHASLNSGVCRVLASQHAKD